MGLAPYGQPIYSDLIEEKLIDIKDDGSFRIDQSYFDYSIGFKMTNNKFNKLFKKKAKKTRNQNSKISYGYSSINSKGYRENYSESTQISKKEFNIENLCLAGGVALNCVVNGLIQKEKIFKNVWIQPAILVMQGGR